MKRTSMIFAPATEMQLEAANNHADTELREMLDQLDEELRDANACEVEVAFHHRAYRSMMHAEESI